MGKVNFFKVIEYYKELDHQREALLWLTNQLPQKVLNKVARIWNAESETVYSLDTYCKYYSATSNQKDAMVELNRHLAPYSQGFFKIWRNKKSNNILHQIVEKLEKENYHVFRRPDEVNIVYVESKEFKPDYFNDWVYLFTFNASEPKLLARYRCTTTPGRKYTINPFHRKGAAIIKPGQYTAWQLGTHIRADHPALVQTGGAVTVYRDSNKDYRRAGEKTESGYFGINIHHGWNMARVNGASAGCLVVQKKADHWKYLDIVKSDPRFKRDRKFIFTATILLEKDL